MDRTSHLLLKALHRTVGPILPPRLLSWRHPRVPGRIHVDDQMLRAPTPDGLDHYVMDADCAIRNLDESLRAASRDWTQLRSVLDLPSGMLTFVLAGGDGQALRFARALELVVEAASLGGVESLVSLPFNMSHSHFTAEQRAAMGIPPGLVRLSVGIEDAADLVADVAQALDRARAG